MNTQLRQLGLLIATGVMLVSTVVARAQQAPADGAAKQAASPPRSKDEANPLPADVRGLDIDEHVGFPLPLELQFTNSEGKLIHLGDYFKSNKPAVIAMVYYKCPVVCDVVMQKITESFNGMDFGVGHDFNCLFFSFDPSETVVDAKASKTGHLSSYGKPLTPEVEAGWQFHVSDVDAARQLSDALGFKYRRLANGQFGHPAAIYVITPEGRISRYFYGFDYPSRDMKLALIDATNGKLVKSIGDRFMSWCYMYDSSKGKYTLVVMRVMQVSGVISATCVGGLVGVLFVGERIRRRLVSKTDSSAGNDAPTPPAAGAAA